MDSVASTQTIRQGLTDNTLSRARLVFLAKLPVFLNSTLDTSKVIRVALEHIHSELGADVVALYLKDGETPQEASYWGIRGSKQEWFEGINEIAEKGVVASVMRNKFPFFVKDISQENALIEIDSDLREVIGTMLCVPLLTRARTCIGALYLHNRRGNDCFQETDIHFVEHFAHQVALAVDNALLFQDATERREELAALDKKKNEIIAIIAHEFRTPLNIIRNSAELVASKDLTEDGGAEVIRLLDTGVERLTKLVSQIRNISLVQNEDLPLERTGVAVTEVFERLKVKHQQVCSGRNLSLDFRLQESALVVEADAALLWIVFQNLVANAIRFTPDGGSIVVSAAWIESGGEKSIEFSVKDTGIGIEKADLPLIFTKFYSVQDAMHHSSGEFHFGSGGLGLGLATVQHILRLHGTTIRVESTPGKGSCFTFVLASA